MVDVTEMDIVSLSPVASMTNCLITVEPTHSSSAMGCCTAIVFAGYSMAMHSSESLCSAAMYTTASIAYALIDCYKWRQC